MASSNQSAGSASVSAPGTPDATQAGGAAAFPAPLRDLRRDCDKLAGQFCQLQAMVFLTHGGTAEDFRSMSTEQQENFMWAIGEKVETMQQLASGICDWVYRASAVVEASQ